MIYYRVALIFFAWLLIVERFLERKATVSRMENVLDIGYLSTDS